MNKMCISFGYNVEKYNVGELNSTWEKNCFAFLKIYNITITITRIPNQ